MSIESRLVVSSTPVLVTFDVAASFAVSNAYLHDRYIDMPGFTWVPRVHDARIAIVNLLGQYQLYGEDLSNDVQYVAKRGSHGRSAAIKTCQQWRRALDNGRYTLAVIATPYFGYPSSQIPAELGWTKVDPGARLVRHENVLGAQEWVFALDGRLDPAACRPTRTRRRGLTSSR